ncbi:MAG: sigma-54 dependent transcriptional regulator [bacterium]
MNSHLKKQNHPLAESMGLLGRSESFIQVLETIKQVAPTNITVLITGESGTGKEIVARAIHELSQRKDKPIISVNCGAIPEGILESELFGHEKGSFTGAETSRKGYFEAANQGTIFLDEIGELPIATQVKLLRVLEQKEFMKVGGTTSVKVNVRVIAATNKNLENEVNNGNFRKDLFYRLNAVKINIPPLRKRKEDIALFAVHYSQKVSRENNIDFKGFTDEALKELENYSWPGNIREIRNLIERLIILKKGGEIDKSDITSHLMQKNEIDTNLPVVTRISPEQAERELIYRVLLDLKMSIEEIRSYLLGTNPKHKSYPDIHTPLMTEILNEQQDESETESILPIHEMEKRQIQKALNLTKGNKKKAARLLNIGERTLYRKIKEYNLEQ